jgi:PIN domain nuclease of toxin-antitoxin system
MIAGGNVEVLVSIATPWEVAIKYRIGKLGETSARVLDAIGQAGMTIVDIRAPHLHAVEALPKGHGDPFDHLILAQAIVEGASIMTQDRQMGDYGVPCIGVN